jgi:glycosyltransferase involved in cell wall biosynthesis
MADKDIDLDSALIIIPAYNEEHNIGNTISEIRQELPKADVCVVDDGSQDNTIKISLNYNVVVLPLPTNLGYSSAIQTGLRYALEENYSYAVTFDADGQHDPRFIPQILSQLALSNCDIVIGSRWKMRDSCKMSLVRKIGFWGLSKAVYLITGQELTDTSSGFQAYSRSGMAALANSQLPVRNPDADVLVSLARQGIIFSEVPVRMRPRAHGEGMNDGTLTMFRYGYHVFVGLLAQLIDPE